ncbi:hypothetical protein SGPA1_10398 [Streptomyces misionensis JCM 4497]
MPPSRSTLRGRPPVDDWVPSSAISPRSTSCPTATEMVEGAAPSRAASSARDDAWPEATSSRTRTARGEVPFAGWRFRALISVMYEVTSATVGVTQTVRPHNADGNLFLEVIAARNRPANPAKCCAFLSRRTPRRVMSSPQKLSCY